MTYATQFLFPKFFPHFLFAKEKEDTPQTGGEAPWQKIIDLLENLNKKVEPKQEQQEQEQEEQEELEETNQSTVTIPLPQQNPHLEEQEQEEEEEQEEAPKGSKLQRAWTFLF